MTHAPSWPVIGIAIGAGVLFFQTLERKGPWRLVRLLRRNSGSEPAPTDPSGHVGSVEPHRAAYDWARDGEEAETPILGELAVLGFEQWLARQHERDGT